MPRVSRISIIVLMSAGHHRWSTSEVRPGEVNTLVRRAFQEALESGDTVREAAVVTNDGIQKYTATEVAELAQPPKQKRPPYAWE